MTHPERLDGLYQLLPPIYRDRDAAENYPLRDLLRVIGEQVLAVEDDVSQLYDGWFIETCAAWVVPYIGDLIGYQPVREAGEASTAGELGRVLTPRCEVQHDSFSPSQGHARGAGGTFARHRGMASMRNGIPTRAWSARRARRRRARSARHPF